MSFVLTPAISSPPPVFSDVTLDGMNAADKVIVFSAFPGPAFVFSSHIGGIYNLTLYPRSCVLSIRPENAYSRCLSDSMMSNDRTSFFPRLKSPALGAVIFVSFSALPCSPTLSPPQLVGAFFLPSPFLFVVGNI